MHMQHKLDPEDAFGLPSFKSLYALTAILAGLLGTHLVLVLLRTFGWDIPERPFGFVDFALWAAILGGVRIVYGALMALIEGDLGADLALAIALVASLLLREYWVGAEVVFIAMVGESLEAMTFARTHREVRKILELQPQTATVVDQAGERSVSIKEVHPGDRVLVRPGERIGVDGVIVRGSSTVDQSTLTGESVPIDREAGQEVYSGTLNQFGALEIEVRAVGSETTLGQVIRLVSEAQENKAKLERHADRLARVFLPGVLIAAAATLIYTNWGVAGSGWNWMPCLAVLVVTCPCALILATPAAVLAALAWLAKRGVLIKGGIALERLAQVQIVAFDKTGTLTKGELQLGDIVLLNRFGEEEALRWAAAAEQQSEHPIANLIRAEALRRGIQLPEVTGFTAIPGAGVTADVRGESSTHAVVAGSLRLLESHGIEVTAELLEAFEKIDRSGQSCTVVALDGRAVGMIGVRDQIRPEAADVVHQLRHLGIEKIALLTGDRPAVARAVANQVEIDEVHAQLLPADKAQWIRQAGAGGLSVAMVGDGVNDAPALASAQAGLALGGVGSDIAAEAGDIVLMGAPLSPLPGLIRLSRAVVRVIRQNIILFAFGVNGVAIALAAAQQLGPVGAAIYHQIGSLLVLLNAMRLLWFEAWEDSFLGRLERKLALVARAIESTLALEQLWHWLRRRYRLCQIVAGCVLVAVYSSQGVYQIQPTQFGVVQRFGARAETLAPGLHFRLPPPLEKVHLIEPRRIQTLEYGFRSVGDARSGTGEAIEWDSLHQDGISERIEEESLVFTGDENLLEVSLAIQYRVSDPATYLFAAVEPEELFRAAVESHLRAQIAVRSFWSVLTGSRSDLERQIGQALEQPASDVGLAIVAVGFQEVHPPLDVVDAFHSVSSAAKESQRLQRQATGYKRTAIIRTGGIAARQRLEQTDADEVPTPFNLAGLSGEAQARVDAARGESERQIARAGGRSQSFELLRGAIATERSLSGRRLYLERIRSALRGKQITVLDPAAASRRQIFLNQPTGADPIVLPATTASGPHSESEPASSEPP